VLKQLVIGVVSVTSLTCECPGEEPTAPNAASLALEVTPRSQQVAQGGSVTFAVQIGRSNFNGPVTLGVPAPSASMTVSFSPQVIPAGATTAMATVTVAPNASYSFNAAGIPEAQSIFISAVGPKGEKAPDVKIDIAVMPSSQAGVTLNVAPIAFSLRFGESGQGIVTVNRQGGYTGRISLTLEDVDSRVPVTLTPNGSTPDSYILRVGVTAPGPSFGIHRFKIRATPEGLTSVTTLVTVTVPILFFAPELARSSVTSLPDGRDTVTVFLKRNIETAGAFTLSLVNPPAGISGTFSPNPAVDDISVLAVRSTAAVAPGTYPLTILVTPPPNLGLDPKTVSLNYIVTAPPVTGSYTLAASDVSVVAGSPATTSVSVTRSGGFTSPVTVSVARTGGAATPAGLAIAVDNPVAQSAGLRITTSAQTPAGIYGFTVTGSAPGLANVTTTFTVTVTAPRRATSILVFKRVNGVPQGTSAESVPQGSTVALEATVLDQNGAVLAGAPVTWTSTNTGAATVSSTGVVTGVAPGNANVIARSTDNAAVEATVAITVTGPASNVARVEIEPRDARITAPATQQYLVNYFNASGARISSESGGSLQFLTSNSAVADINASSGMATGKTAGSTNITARYLRNGVFVVQDVTTLTVAAAGTPGNYGSLTFSIQGGIRDIRLAHGYTFQLIVRDPAGNQVTSGVTPAPTYSSSNPLVTVAPSEPPPGAPPGYYFSLNVPSNATVGSTVQIRYDVAGAGGTVNLTIVP